MNRGEREDLDVYMFNRHERPARETPAETERGSSSQRDLVIRTDDGVPLAATVTEPRSESSRRRVVVIASATGVLRRYYGAFASWLAEQGFVVVTFDYRGIGGSKAEHASMKDWGERDLAAVVAWAGDVLGDGRVSVIGHSVGGQLLGFLPAPSRVAAIVTVASQSGDYRLWPMPMRLAMAALWYGFVPTVTHAVGYLPGRLGIGEDLPPGVALEWARWCRTPGYIVGDESWRRDGFARHRAPILSFGFGDDPYAPRAAVDALHALFVSTKVLRRHVPEEEGRFGHFGFFRKKPRNIALWREIADFLETSTSAGAAPVRERD